jgi:hypothetical protein
MIQIERVLNMTILNANNGDAAAVRYDVVKNCAQSKTLGRDVFCSRTSTRVKSLAEVADTMVREGSKYEANEVVAILEKFAKVTTRLLQEGYAVNVGSLVRFRPSIRGKFETVDEAFSKAKHRIVVRASVGSALRNVAATASVQRITAIPLPEITTVYNGLTGTLATLDTEGPLVVLGKRFTWDATAEDEGFFTEVNEVRQPCEIFSIDTARTSVFMNTSAVMGEGIQATLYFATRNTANGELATIRYALPLAYEAQAEQTTEG